MIPNSSEITNSKDDPYINELNDAAEEDQSEQNEKEEWKEDLGESDTNILIPDSDNEEGVERRKRRKGVFLMTVGGLVSIISILIQLTADISWDSRAAPVYAIITGLHLSFLGIFLHLDPKERANFEVMINGRQLASSMPLRAIIWGTINFTFSITGIICMSVMADGYYWYTWNIFGLVLSLLIAVVTLIHILAGILPPRYKLPTVISTGPFPLDTKLQDLVTCMDDTTQDLVTCMADTTHHLVTCMVDITMALLPELSTPCLGEKLRAPVSLRHSTLHQIAIALSMLLAATMFSAQLADVVISPGADEPTEMSRLGDPKDTYARNWLNFLGLGDTPINTKLMVLISNPVTILLCLPLFLMTCRASMLHLILAFFLAGAMASFHCLLSVTTMSWMIILGPSVTPISMALRMGITLVSPIQAALLLALAFSYIDNLLQRKEPEDETSSCCRKISTALVIVLTLVTLGLTIAALTCSTGGLMISLQGHWNSTQSGRYKAGCMEDRHRDYNYNRWETTTPPPSTWPAHCFGVSLDYGVENSFRFFSLTQLSLSETLLVLGLLLLLTGNRISLPILLFLGVATFTAAISMVISYFISIFDYVAEIPNLFFFYILNGCQVALGLVLGFGFSIAGCSFFVILLSFLLRSILTIVTISCLLLFTLVGGIITLAKTSVKADLNKKERQIKEVSEDKMESDA